MTTSYFSIPVSVLCSLLVVIKGFNAFGQSLIPASVSMEAASPCSGSINMITFRANGVCPSVYVQWNIPGQNFVFHSSGGNWIKGYFTAGGDKTIGCYYRGVYTSGACDFKENYIYGVYKIGESSPIAGIISGDLQRCSGETGGLAVSNFRGEILGWEKKLPEQTWSSAAFISVYSSSLPSQYIDDETKNYRVKIGSNCVSPVYAYATVNVIRANQPTASNLTGYCGTIPEVLVHSQADPGGTVYHNWYAADQLVPFTEILSTFVDYGNDIYESSNKPSTFAVYDLSAKVNGCVSKKTRINVTYQNPTPPPSGFNFFINTINSPGKSIKSCTGENIDVTVSANMVSGFKWYYPDNLNFDNDNRAIISAAKMSPGANSIKVTGTFKNECGASTTITDYFTVYFTSPSLTIINPDADAKYCNNETVKIGSAAYPLNPQNTSYSWILNSEPIGISASFESVLNPGNYSIQCVLKADFTGCLFPKNLSSNKLSFKVLTRPGLPTAGNVTQECPGQPVSFTVSSSLNAGYVVKHAWYNSTDLFITEKETSNPTSTVYFSTYYPDAFPESSRTFKVSAKVIDGSFACESGKTSVTYTKSFPGPPPSSLNFFVFSVNSATHSVNACNGEFIDVMVSGTNLKDFKWYYPAGSVFDTDYRAVIKTDLLNPGKNSIKVTSNYTDECGAVYGITDYFIVNITVPELVISGMNPSGKYCKNESISLKCQTIPAGPTNAIYNWYINNTWASSAMDYSSLLNVGSYEVFSRVTAKFYGCLFSKTIQSKTTPFKVMPVPDPPYATDTYQNCPDQITPIIATTNFEAGRMINHILYNSMDQIVTERTASNISTNVYSSSFYPDPFPESSRIFKVAAKLVDGTYGCESAKREVNYIKDFPPPPPGNLLFIFNDEITPKDNIHICRNDKLRIEALEIPQVSDYTWYGQDGREIEQEPDYSILLTGDDLFPGVNNIIVNAVYDDGCIPGGIPVTDQIIIDLHSISPPVISGVKHSCDTTIVIKSEPGNASWYWQTDPQNPEFVNNNPEFMLTDNGNVILMAFDGYCWSEPVIQEISVVKSPVLQVTGSTELCQGSSVSLNAEAPGAITYIWYSAEHKQVLHYGSKYNSPELQGNTAFSVASFNEKGCRSELTLNIRIYPPNEVLPSIPFLTKPGNDYILHLNNDPTPDFNFYWVTGPEGTHGLVQDEVSPANPGEAYFVRSLDKNGCWGPAVSVIVPDILLEEYQQPLVPEILNYTKALNFKKESTSPDPDNPYEINMITEYTDGLGRTIQKVSRQASPLRMDIVEMIKYDAISNEVIRTLPFVCGTSDGDLKASPVKEMIRFYHSSDKIPRNDFPFTLTLSETSPLRRKLEIGHPGEPWVFAIGSANAKTERFSWQVNSNDDQVIRWVPAQGRLIHEGFYTEGSLLKNITTDENGYRTIEFMNKQQRLILKRTQADPDGQEWAEIYYIYDNSGNLLFAVQPEVIRQVKESGSGFIMISGDPGNNTLINNMVFEYKYDERNRMIAKKIPGSGWIRMVYDRWDRIVFTQDGNQSKRNEWSYTKYDQLNRPIITGILNSVATAAELAIQLNEGDYGRSEERNNESIYGYTLNFSYPPLAGLDVLTVTFYDDYSFPHADEETFRFIPELKNEIRNENVTDMITGTMIIIPGTEKYLKSVIYYDDRYRIIQTISTNNEGGFDRESSMIEKLTGRVLETRTTHINPRSVNPVNTISKILDYDHMDRLTSIMHGIATSVTWEQSKNIQVEGNLITRKSGKGSSISGAISEKKIGANSDGWIEFTADQTTNTRVIGLTDNIISLSANTINYAFILDNGNARISESGLLSDSVIPFKVGDKFRIERINNKILFSINNRYIMQSENPGSPELFVKIYLLNEGATAYDVRISTTGGVFMAGNEYNELGMLIEKNIHELDSGKFLQSVDYRYNIRGWLTNINNSALAEDPGTNNDSTDYFGMELFYESPPNKDLAQFNGNISGASWSNAMPGNGKKKSYLYGYDPMNRLKNAGYHEWDGNEWIESPGYQVPAIRYDLNGNILSLSRNGIANGIPVRIDELQYTYTGNQLVKVDDAGNEYGFHDGVDVTGEFLYDENGNMTSDENKGITDIKYNHLNLPERLVFRDSSFFSFTYDATGKKQSREAFDANGKLYERVNYCGEFIYKNDTLQQILTSEGRIVDPYDDGFARYSQYQYFLKDHLGNTRVTFKAGEDIVYQAGFESTDQPSEAAIFPGYEDLTIITGDIYDHTDIASPGFVERLSGSEGEVIGISKSLLVGGRDTVRMKVYAKYFEITENNTGAGKNILAELTDAFEIVQGGEQQMIYDAFTEIFRAGPVISIDDLEDENAPKAFLNYIFIDDKMQAVQMGFDQIDRSSLEDGTDVEHDLLSLEFVAPGAGFLYIYVSNENDRIVDVFFDDFSITHFDNPIIQTDDYYPFGMSMEGLSYQRYGELHNRFKYNGKELQDDLGLNWYDYGARMYMPDLGRWGVVDPLFERHFESTPYSYVYNNPIRLIDPFGLDSAQRATAINQMQNHINKGTSYKSNVSFYNLPNGNDPGKPGNCSSTASNCVVKAGEPNPSRTPDKGDKGSGVLNIEANTIKVNNNIQEGNLISFRIESPKYPYHIGLIMKVEKSNDGNPVISFGHNQSGTGAIMNSFTLGDGTIWDQRFSGAFKWDTKPDLPMNQDFGTKSLSDNETYFTKGDFSIGALIMINSLNGTGAHSIGRWLYKIGL